MKTKVDLVLRIILGLMFAFFGLNKLLHFMDMPLATGAAGDFFTGLATGGYFFYFLGLFEAASGILLLINRYTGLALAMLAPITINIFLFHVFLDQAGLMMGIPVIGLNAYLAYASREKFSGVLSAS